MVFLDHEMRDPGRPRDRETSETERRCYQLLLATSLWSHSPFGPMVSKKISDRGKILSTIVRDLALVPWSHGLFGLKKKLGWMDSTCRTFHSTQ